MKITMKFNDFGRCLICSHNPCDCKKDKPKELPEYSPWKDKLIEMNQSADMLIKNRKK